MKIQKSIEDKIKAAFKPSHLEVENESAKHRRNPKGETHFRVVIVAASFTGKTRVDRHRLVQALFEEERGLGLHATTLTTLTPAEWDKSKATATSPACATTKRP